MITSIVMTLALLNPAAGWAWLNDDPAKWPECKTIRWSMTGPYKYAMRYNIKHLSALTNLTFKEVRKNADLRISWIPESENEDLVGDIVASVRNVNRGGTIVASRIILDSSEPLEESAWYSVFMHELGHAVGLGHVDETQSLMYPVVDDITITAGDRAGFKAVGGSCVRW